MQQSFEIISGYKQKITFRQFEEWVRDSRALVGFDATQRDVQAVFADLDPHKKGYLVEGDWIIAFDGFHWRKQMLQEVKATIETYFAGGQRQRVLEFLAGGGGEGKQITLESFSNALRQLFQGRFTHQDIVGLWKEIAKDSATLSDAGFDMIYSATAKASAAAPNNNKRPQTAAPAAKTSASLWETVNHKLPAEMRMDEETQRIVRKVKQIMRASNRSIEEVFKSFDKDGSGDISNLEFKEAFRKLGIGLTSREIDHLLNFCDESGDGNINWVEFVTKF